MEPKQSWPPEPVNVQLSGRLPSRDYWFGKRVLVTGHTGFKGSWLVAWLRRLGADVSGASLPQGTKHSLFDSARISRLCKSHQLDVRDLSATINLLAALEPEIVIHLAAQPLVQRSYHDPLETFETNANGTLNLLEAVRRMRALPRVVLVVTTDKVYRNDGSGIPFTETDSLGGHDPYAASKAAAEIIVASYRASYFSALDIAVATARGGNVIGGGDYSEYRLVPDIYRAAVTGKRPLLRHPEAVRPWQHVLDCLTGYLIYIEELDCSSNMPASLNIGPDATSALTVREVAETIMKYMGMAADWDVSSDTAFVEASQLRLDVSAAKKLLGWRERLPGSIGLAWTAAWYANRWRNADALELISNDLDRFEVGEIRG